MSLATKPTFIGNFRSGTTLLVNLLGIHEAIVPWFETKWMCEALRYLRVMLNPAQRDYEASLIVSKEPDVFTATSVAGRMLQDIRGSAARIEGETAHGKAPHERYMLGHDYILYSVERAEESVQEWLDQVMSVDDPVDIAHATGRMISSLGDMQIELSGKPYWINKTPEICRFGQELRLCLGSARIILMIRNGRDVVRSAKSLGWAETRQLANWWRGMIEQSRAASSDHKSDYLEIRYEALVDHPAEEVNRVLRFLGMDESGGRMVRAYQQQIAINRVSPGIKSERLDTNPDGHEGFEDLFDKEFMLSLGYA